MNDMVVERAAVHATPAEPAVRADQDQPEGGVQDAERVGTARGVPSADAAACHASVSPAMPRAMADRLGGTRRPRNLCCFGPLSSATIGAVRRADGRHRRMLWVYRPRPFSSYSRVRAKSFSSSWSFSRADWPAGVVAQEAAMLAWTARG